MRRNAGRDYSIVEQACVGTLARNFSEEEWVGG